LGLRGTRWQGSGVIEWLHDMWSSPKMKNEIKKIEMGGTYSACGRAAYKVMMVWES